MQKTLRIALAALALATIAVACTPAGSSSLVPAPHYMTPMDGGGGFPPSPSPNVLSTP